MKRQLLLGSLAIISIGYVNQLQAQGFLKKAKQKLEQKGNDAIDGLFGDNKESGNDTSGSGNKDDDSGYNNGDNSSRGRNSGSTPGNKKMTPPDVVKNIEDAKSSMNSKNYSDARFAIHQAIIGIEYELGKKILESMPGSLEGMSSISEQDEIYSSGIGFVGLSIGREYESNNKWAKASVLNNSVMLSSYNMILSNAAYTNNSEEYKVTKIGNYRAVLEYTSNGINVAIPFGQSSIFFLELDGVSEESDAESLASAFDISKFKEILGEQ